VTRSSGSGLTGARSASPSRETGTPAACMYRAVLSTTTTSRPMGTLRNSGTRTSAISGTRRTGIPRSLSALRQDRGQVLRRAWQSPWELRLLELEAPTLELRERRAQKGHRGDLAEIARVHGLKFGITYHGTPGRTWREFMPVRYGSDKTGPLKDVPYDGVMTKADGKGKWWEGMEPAGTEWPPARQKRSLPGVRREFHVAGPGRDRSVQPGPPLLR